MICETHRNNYNNHARFTTRHRFRGFTLLEVMVVIVILGLMAAMIVPNVTGQLGKARQKTAKSEISSLSNALDMYQLENFQYPTTDQGLQSLLSAPSGDMPNFPPGGYLKKKNIKDPWEREYLYISPGQHGTEYDIFTYGRDGAPGGDGEDMDIGSWD